jgi:epoxyqueuosine reductase QueG
VGTAAANAQFYQRVESLVIEAPENRLADFDDLPIFGSPAIAVADGDDPAFQMLRQAVSPEHMQPRDVLARHASPGGDLAHVRVVVWALPFTKPVRRSNRGGRWPSRLYSAARNNGGALNFAVRRRLAEHLRAEGYAAAAPVLDDRYDAFRSPRHTFASTWSERHAAWAAGLGLFGLSGALITPLGTAVRIGSVVTTAPLEPTPRESNGHRAPCLADGGAQCGQCIERCPVGAISASGLDKERCYAMRKAVRQECLDEYARALRLLTAPVVKSGQWQEGYSLGCALCQAGVPCEFSPPEAPD